MESESSVPSAVKPALVSGKKKNKERKPKDLKWDEKAIEEHDQLRGTRMKIEEPNTPYHNYDSGSETDGSTGRSKSPTDRQQISWDHLQSKLDSVAAVREQYPSSPSSHGGGADEAMTTGSGDPNEERRLEMKRLEFAEHRKRHYNEMEMVRKFRAEHPDSNDDAAALLVDKDDDDADDEHD